MIVGAEFATNAISYAALSKAATGVRAIISELIERLMHGTENDFLAPLARVLAIGSTSGSDIVAGIVSGLRLQLEFEQTVQPTAADPK
jgi:two-component sensor histidine kinase